MLHRTNAVGALAWVLLFWALVTLIVMIMVAC